MDKKISSNQNFLIVAKFGKTNGLDGKINVKSFFSNAFDILKYKNFFLENSEKISVKFQKTNDKILAKIEKINSPEAAQKFVGKLLRILKKRIT